MVEHESSLSSRLKLTKRYEYKRGDVYIQIQNKNGSRNDSRCTFHPNIKIIGQSYTI